MQCTINSWSSSLLKRPNSSPPKRTYHTSYPHPSLWASLLVISSENLARKRASIARRHVAVPPSISLYSKLRETSGISPHIHIQLVKCNLARSRYDPYLRSRSLNRVLHRCTPHAAIQRAQNAKIKPEALHKSSNSPPNIRPSPIKSSVNRAETRLIDLASAALTFLDQALDFIDWSTTFW